MLMIGLLLLAGCGRAGESEFCICDVAKRARKRGEDLQSSSHRQILDVVTMRP